MADLVCGLLLLAAGYFAGVRQERKNRLSPAEPDERDLEAAKAYDRLQRYTGRALKDDE